MDVVDMLLPPGPSPTLGLTLNGRPLPDVVLALATALRTQAAEAALFRKQYAEEHASVCARLSSLERRVEGIEHDLEIKARPVAAYGQAQQPTIYKALTNIEYRIYKAEQKNKVQTYHMVRQHSEKTRLSECFSRLLKWRNARYLARRLGMASSTIVMQRFMNQWRVTVANIVAQRAMRRKVRGMLFLSAKTLAGRYLEMWLKYHTQMKAQIAAKRAHDATLSDRLATLAHRGLARRYYVAWIGYRAHIIYNAERWQLACRLAAASSRAHCRDAFLRWAAAAALMAAHRQRVRIVAARHKQAARALALRYLLKWQRRTVIAQGRAAKVALIARMSTAAALRLAGRYYNNLKENMRSRAAERRIKELTGYIAALARRYDALGSQLDLGLDSLAHTNGVLSRVVDTLLLTSDAPQVQALLGIHRGDQKLRQRITWDGAKAVGGENGPQPAARDTSLPSAINASSTAEPPLSLTSESASPAATLMMQQGNTSTGINNSQRWRQISPRRQSPLSPGRTHSNGRAGGAAASPAKGPAAARPRGQTMPVQGRPSHPEQRVLSMRDMMGL